MLKLKPWLYFIASAGLGFGVIHPLIMLTASLMPGPSAAANYQASTHLLTTLQMAFGYSMLPWGFGLGLLCAVVGWLLARIGQVMAREQKLQGVLELAGAACHELNQPMQVVMGYADLLSQDLRRDDATRKMLQKIIGQIGKMDRILKNIRAIARYETKPYIEGVSIIDIEKSAGRNDLPSH
jgi:signal transduction histidine kinase